MAELCNPPSVVRLHGQTLRTHDELLRSEEWKEHPSHSDEWLATLSHELRSPLATILSALDVMADDGGDASVRRAREVAERQARKAMQIIEDLFDVSAGFRGQLPLRKEMVDLAEIAAAAIETTGHQLDARRHALTISVPALPVIVFADPLRLEQVLTNLLTNAAKFMATGGQIRLTIRIETGAAVLQIADNGRGIAPELLPRVFDQFMQVRDSGDCYSKGLGIGLALVKTLVELHGGSVTANSRGLGMGSEFTVRLPMVSSLS